MRAILLAAGLGTRLRPLTDVLPKCLAPVRGRPLLEYWFREVFAHGVDEAVVNMHHHADMVADFIARGPWRERIRFAFEPQLLGTGGTVLKHNDFISRGPFLLAHADNLSAFELETFVRAHASRPRHMAMTMMTFDSSDPSSCGIVETDAAGVVVGFHEKVHNPPGNRANAAVYICEPDVVALLSATGKQVIDLSTEIIPRLIGRIATWHNAKYHRDIGTLQSWRAAQHECPLEAPEPPSPDPWRELLMLHPEVEECINRLLSSGR